MTKKKARAPIRWVQSEADGPYALEVDDLVVASAGERRYEVPAVFHSQAFALKGDDGRRSGFVAAEIDVSSGRPRFRDVTFTIEAAMTPREMQRIPWGRMAEVAIAVQAGETVTERREVMQARARDRRATEAQGRRARERSKEPAQRVYRQHTPEVLREVARLRREAETEGLPYAAYVGERLGYRRDSYVRRLAKLAKAAGC